MKGEKERRKKLERWESKERGNERKEDRERERQGGEEREGERWEDGLVGGGGGVEGWLERGKNIRRT